LPCELRGSGPEVCTGFTDPVDYKDKTTERNTSTGKHLNKEATNLAVG
jgi:hypothetical protein